MQITAVTAQFIADHAGEDVQKLALAAHRDPDLDLPFALNQIAGREQAKKKLPLWAATAGVIYPPHLAMEQCSSQVTAEIKCQLATQLLTIAGVHKDSGVPKNAVVPTDADEPTNTHANSPSLYATMADLTGGFGVDFSYLARLFHTASYVEQQEVLCDIAIHNMLLLGLPDAHIIHADGTQYLHSMDPVSLIYIDPARRSESGSRTYAISDCTPNVLELKQDLLAKAPAVLIKLSPMLDWRKTVRDFDGNVAIVGIIATNNECKDLVIGLTRERHDHVHVTCVNDRDIVQFTADMNGTILNSDITALPALPPQESWKYLYEPNAALMKGGCYDLLAQRYNVAPVSRNSHLYVSSQAIDDFPGRAFAVQSVGTLNKKSVRKQFADIDRANVAVRNFPMTAVQLRRRLKLRDGGDTYVFGTTDERDNHLIMVCTRLASTIQ